MISKEANAFLNTYKNNIIGGLAGTAAMGGLGYAMTPERQPDESEEDYQNRLMSNVGMSGLAGGAIGAAAPTVYGLLNPPKPSLLSRIGSTAAKDVIPSAAGIVGGTAVGGGLGSRLDALAFAHGDTANTVRENLARQMETYGKVQQVGKGRNLIDFINPDTGRKVVLTDPVTGLPTLRAGLTGRSLEAGQKALDQLRAIHAFDQASAPFPGVRAAAAAPGIIPKVKAFVGGSMMNPFSEARRGLAVLRPHVRPSTWVGAGLGGLAGYAVAPGLVDAILSGEK